MALVVGQGRVGEGRQEEEEGEEKEEEEEEEGEDEEEEEGGEGEGGSSYLKSNNPTPDGWGTTPHLTGGEKCIICMNPTFLRFYVFVVMLLGCLVDHFLIDLGSQGGS